jgi:hypothetical protein
VPAAVPDCEMGAVRSCSHGRWLRRGSQLSVGVDLCMPRPRSLLGLHTSSRPHPGSIQLSSQAAVSRQHPGSVQAASRQHPGSIQAASRQHPGSIQAVSRQHPGRSRADHGWIDCASKWPCPTVEHLPNQFQSTPAVIHALRSHLPTLCDTKLFISDGCIKVLPLEHVNWTSDSSHNGSGTSSHISDTCRSGNM